MHRLRCGVIYTNAFAGYLTAFHQQNTPLGAPRILALEYLRSTTEAWWHMEWVPEQSAPVDCRFLIDHVPVYLSPQSQRGLKNRCLDWRDGAVVVRS